MAVELTEDVLADVEKIFKSNRGDFSASALKINQMAYCLNTGLPDVGMEIVVRLTENLTLGQSFVSAGDASTSYYFFPIESVDIPESPFIPLAGVDENKVYISKVDDNTISVIAGSGIIRKSDLTEVKRTWNAIASVDVSSVLDGQLRWCVFQNDGTETGLEFTLLSSAPVLLDDAEQYLWVGRIWRENGILQVGGQHIMLSVDPQVSRTNVWQFPAGNVSVTVHHATDVGLLSLSAGELTRWPVVESGTYHHVWKYSGLATVSSMWDHVQGSAGFTTISDNSAGDTTDIRTIADYYDNNGTLTVVPQNDWVAHLIGVYAGSEERVLFRGQRTYADLADAKLGITIDPLEEADWAKDLRQISKIGWMLVREGTRDFSDSARCVFVPYSLLGSGGGSGTTPNLEQVLGVGGDVDITDNLDTDRVMSFIKNGERILSVLGSGEVASALSSIADLRVGLSRVFNRFVSLGRSQFGNASDTGATISVVDQSGVAGELFTVDDFVSDTEGLYTLSAQVDADYGEACYEFTSGGGTTYYAYKGNVNTEAYWFVGTTILTGSSAFTNCQYRSTQPVTLPSALPSDAPAYDGVNAPDTAQQGVFQNQSGESKESINAETISATKIQAEDGSTVWSSMSEFAKQLYWQVLNTHYMELLPNEFNVHLDNAYRVRATGSYSGIESPDGTTHVRVFNGRNDITGDAVFTAGVAMNAIPSGLPAGKTKAGNLAITTDGILYYE